MRILKAGDRLAIAFQYDPKIVQLVKSLDGRQFHPRQKMWSIPLVGCKPSVDKLCRWGFTLETKAVQAIQEQARQEEELVRLSKAKDVEFLSSLPLFPYQRVGAAFCLRVGSGLLGDDMGLGKTIQAMAVVEAAKAQRVLIICPAALKYQWQSEIKKFLNEGALVIDGTKGERLHDWACFTGIRAYDPDMRELKTRFVVMNYELLLREDFEYVSQVKWDYIIADEATKISNPRAKVSKAIKKIPAKNRLALTGTPISNRAQEVWNIIDWVSPGAFGSYWNFQERYCVKNHFGAITQDQNLDELNQKLKRHMIRRVKEEVLPDLPEKISSEVPVKLSEKERTLYNKIREELLFEIQQQDLSKVENPVSIQYTLVKMTRLAQLANSMELLGESQQSSKLDVLKELLEETMSVPGRKAIVFTKFAEMADILARELYEYAPLVISGKSEGKYQEIVDKFNDWEQHRILIMTSAGQYGLNIQRASVLFHYDQEWSLGKMLQREGRAHRIGQKDTVLVYHLLAKGTLDMYVKKTLHRKATLSDTVLGDQVTMEDIKNILTYEVED